jgi:Rad9
MDCIIPGVSIRPFCAAISCLSRIGKELYIDFDPLDGLSLRALNDSKSVFGSFHYEPAFFTRCNSAMRTLVKKSSSSKKNRKRRRGTTRGHRANANDDNDNDNDDGSDSDDDNDAYNASDNDERWTVKIAMKALAPIVRSRKDVLHLQLSTVRDHLAFEFHIQKFDGSVVRIVHKVGYAPANGVAAVASMDGSSELVIQPHVLATMLEPLKRSIEIAILVNDKHRLVSSVTFSHDDLPEQHATAVLTRQQQQASVKTEVSVGYDDLVEVHYVGLAGRTDDDDDEETTVSQSQVVQAPADLKEQVVLVFTLKEFKSFLQFCAQAVVDQELQLSIQFHWGGRPMVLKTVGENFHGELFMATLDHNLLGDMRTSNTTSTTTAAATPGSRNIPGRTNASVTSTTNRQSSPVQ